MANTREIQSRMKSIQDTMKITNAMYMISSSKMQKAKRILSDTEPYYYNMQKDIPFIFKKHSMKLLQIHRKGKNVHWKLSKQL